MKNRIVLCLGLVTILSLAGCSPLDREPLKTMNDLATSFKKAGDTLAKVHDANSAEAATSELDARFGTMIDLMKRMPEFARKYEKTQVSKDALDKVMKNLTDGGTHFTTQMTRLDEIRGLPLPFWKVVKFRSLELGLAAVDAASVGASFASAGEREGLLRVRELFDRCGYEQTVTVVFTNMSGLHAQSAMNRLQKLAPEATLVEHKDQAVTRAILGPIKDFHAFAAAIDFGAVVADEPRRMINVSVDTAKLLMGSHGPGHASPPAAPEAIAQRQREAQERSQREMEESQARWKNKVEADHAAREKEENGDPNDPAYFETMAERMTSSDVFRRRKAIDAMLKADPAAVTSPDTRKKIARNFRAMAEDSSPFEREKAIRGLVLWAGKYSVPLLLKMLADKHPMNEELLIASLGEFQDERAAPALAARLGNFRFHDVAFNALNAMGSAAEDAVLEVAPSRDRKICLAALTLLGNVGTEKSLGMMQKAIASRYPDVRATAMAAQQKIKLRARQAKAAAASGE